MTNKPKAIGTRAETKVVRFLEEHGIKAERRALHGNQDLGDILVPEWNNILEVKAGKQTDKYNRKLKEEWLKQTVDEACNASSKDNLFEGFLVIAVHGRSTKDYEVWSEDGHRFWYLDQWCESLRNMGEILKIY